MTPFELIEPCTLREAAELLASGDPSVRPMAGGTAVMLMMKMGVLRPTRLVNLHGVEKRYSEISDGDGELRFGAMVTLSALERSSVVKTRAPVIARALRTLANVRVRNVATVGGHLAHADPHMDLPPVLIALGATVSTVQPKGGRTLPLEKLYAGYLETTLGREELIAEVIVPAQGSRHAAYLKCTTRSADDWPALGVAVVLDTDGALVRDARIVISAATDVPTRLTSAEKALTGTRVDDKTVREVGDAAASMAEVMGDEHGSAAYKRELVRVYVARAVRAALSEK
ncbi:MAG: xanthine dehydrogenase family protein subunit M [Betaproteobacteria bacterium]|nr:xanthine dehydrogenase family protein subunit M [Betaproteobacteria bacterium]MDH3437829.1 xanthine dehydrogenase family protein subunit M [Betaproteobacteria bacterium]